MATRRGWWITGSAHVLTDDVPAACDDVRDFYCDLDNIVRLHPLVMSVDVTGRERTEYSHTETYRVRDRIPIGPFALKVGYTARVHVPDDGDVLTEARQFPHVRLCAAVSFDAIDGGTRVTERLVVSAPRPLAAFTVGKAVAAHVEMLAGIRLFFAGISPED